jgi:uncharacterized small protein (DUF1192 family)
MNTTTIITRLTAIFGPMNTTTEHAVVVLVKNLWNCTLEDKMTGFFCVMIHQIIRPEDKSISFEELKEIHNILTEERENDIARMKAEREEKIAAIRARNAAFRNYA